MPTIIRDILAEEISDARITLLLKQHPNVTREEIDKVAQCDPTPTGSYLPWILKLYVAKTIRLPEDESKVKQRLGEFDKLKKKRGFEGHRDINKYKSYGELAQTIELNSGVKTKGEITRELAIDGAELLAEKDNLKLYKVTTVEAGLALGWRDTEWCVKDPKFFDDYGPPFYCIVKDGKPYTLLHMGGGSQPPQVMDKYDNETSVSEYVELGFDFSSYFSSIGSDQSRHGAASSNIDWAIGQSIRMEEWPEFARWLIDNERINGILKYAENVLHSTWPEAEPVLLKRPLVAVTYAARTGRRRWPELERVLSKWDDLTSATRYAAEVRRSRWPELEAELLSRENVQYDIFTYVMKVIGERWPEAEPIIMTDAQSAAGYASRILDARWPEAEPVIMRSPKNALFYATSVIRGRWPEAEPFIRQEPVVWGDYVWWMEHFAHVTVI